MREKTHGNTESRAGAVDEILGLPEPSSDTREKSLEVMLGAVARKRRTRRAAGAAATIACAGFAVIFGVSRRPNQSQPELIAPARGRPYELVTTRHAGFTVVRSEPSAAVTIIESLPRTAVNEIDDSALLALFPDTAAVLIGGGDDAARRLVVAQTADTSTLRKLAKDHVLTW